MSTIYSLISSILDWASNELDKVKYKLSASDTRSVNSPPSFYMDKGMGTVVEFKSCSTIGISGEGSYCQLETHILWGDSSGGRPCQIAFTQNGNVWVRHGSSDSAWTAWQNANNKYSTTETVIGFWTDGKPVYRYVQNGTTPSNNNSFSTSVRNIDKMINLYGCINNTDSSATVNNANGASDYCRFWVQSKANGTIWFNGAGTGYQKLPYTLVMEYTKK